MYVTRGRGRGEEYIMKFCILESPVRSINQCYNVLRAPSYCNMAQCTSNCIRHLVQTTETTGCTSIIVQLFSPVFLRLLFFADGVFAWLLGTRCLPVCLYIFTIWSVAVVGHRLSLEDMTGVLLRSGQRRFNFRMFRYMSYLTSNYLLCSKQRQQYHSIIPTVL